MTKAEIRAEVRRLLYEVSADLWTDDDVDAHVAAEIRRLPSKGIYLEEIWEATKVKNQPDYSLPSGSVKLEDLEENFGSDSVPDWQPMAGWDVYGGALWLRISPTDTRDIRGKLRKKFTADLAEDTTESDIPEEKLDLVFYGAAIRAYQQLIGYMVDQKNYDAIVKPDGITINHVRAFIKDLREEYKLALREIQTIPKPREIDLTG